MEYKLPAIPTPAIIILFGFFFLPLSPLELSGSNPSVEMYAQAMKLNTLRTALNAQFGPGLTSAYWIPRISGSLRGEGLFTCELGNAIQFGPLSVLYPFKKNFF